MFLLKKFYIKLLYPFIAMYIKKERPFTYKGFNMTILPGVFHPGFFFSSKFFFSFIDSHILKGKRCLEIGCGSGLLSLLMLRKQGQVTAIDIQELAIKNTDLNYEKNREQFGSHPALIKSDLFDAIKHSVFDFIVINPPYFFAEVTQNTEHAWYCGEHGEYFQKLFSQLPAHIRPETGIFMVLADNCDINRIKKIAGDHKFALELISQKKIWWEDNFIFKINLTNFTKA